MSTLSLKLRVSRSGVAHLLPCCTGCIGASRGAALQAADFLQADTAPWVLAFADHIFADSAPLLPSRPERPLPYQAMALTERLAWAVLLACSLACGWPRLSCGDGRPLSEQMAPEHRRQQAARPGVESVHLSCLLFAVRAFDLKSNCCNSWATLQAAAGQSAHCDGSAT